MLLLFIFSFIAGIVTILSPCILPVLPIVLSGGITNDKKKPLGVIVGFILSFTFFTLFLSSLVKLTGIPSDLLRFLSIITVFMFGLSLLIPRLQFVWERIFNIVAQFAPQKKDAGGFFGGILLGVSLGLLWTPCVGPIIASVITLAAANTVTFATILITLSYSLGTAIPLFVIMLGGRKIVSQHPFFVKNTLLVQKIFGVFMILTAGAILFNFDRTFQQYILTTFPQYGTNLTKIENNPQVVKQLTQLKSSPGEIFNSTAAPEIVTGGTWLNTAPLSISELKGKVVLVDFWTYTCINCIRSLPHVVSWYEKYKDKGFIVIGIHTPEFEFEKKTENVKDAIARFGIKYPILQDNDYKNWNAYNNQYWPAEYLIDAKGNIRHTNFGEGDYDNTEKNIQILLREAGATIQTSQQTVPDTTPQSAISPETYLGSTRTERNAATPDNLPLHYYSFAGNWNVQPEYASTTNNCSLYFHFLAQHVYLVMHPAARGDSAKVFIDDKPIDVLQQGKDVIHGRVSLDTERLYDLVNLKDVQDHILKIEFQNTGTQCFAFTFG